ncbi:MBL fold metallo-hydrolase [Corynebacterium lowii]|uniref:MBL fold metallo-hydrolase n=1 Tax=Corynebacterium lowii TaxID=1544413 RepID=UPI000AC4AA27|nr:MBL fold metallo-hydrolase [Corynebacterium lowii]
MPGRYANPINKAPRRAAISEQLEERGIHPRDLDIVLMSHLHCDHADGLRLVREAPRIMVSATELRATEKDRARYLPHEWSGVDLQTFNWDTRFGPFQRSWDVFGDGSILMVNVPGHSWGLCATVIRGNTEVSPQETSVLGDDPREVVILGSDVGYGRPSFDEGLRPSVVVDKAMASQSLDWARAAQQDPRVKHLFVNHDPEVLPGIYTLG